MAEQGATGEPVSSERKGSFAERPAVLVLGLFVLAAIAYAGAIDHPFLYDDLPKILKNPRIRSLDQIPAMIGFGEAGFVPRTRWTREVVHAVEFSLVGAWPPLYHATNVALHGIAAWLVYLLVGAISERRWLGWWTAALFTVHPMQTEVVAHVSGRRGLLAAVFALSSLLLLLRYTRVGGAWRVAAACVTVYLATFSKELGVMTPVVFVAIDSYLAVRAAPDRPALGVLGGHLRSRAALYALLAVLTVGLGVVVGWFTQSAAGLAGSPSIYDSSVGGLGPLERLSVVGLALRLLVLPVGQSVDYSFDALGFALGGGAGRTALDLAVLAAGAALAIRGLRRRDWAGFAALWFALFHLPHVGLVPWHEIFAERFVYLPSIGVFAGFAAAGLWCAERLPHPRQLVPAVGAATLAVLTLGTIVRAEVWSSDLALWTAAVERYPNAVRAHKALGDAYLAETRTNDALEHYREAARIHPGFADAQIGVAVALTQRMDLGQAQTQLEEVLRRWPDEPRAWNLAGYIHQTLGRPDEALESYRRAVEAAPWFADGYNNMAKVYAERGDVEKVVEMYEKALEINPGLLPALKNLAVVYREAYQDEERADHYERLFREMKGAR